MKFGMMYEIQIPEPHYPGIERDRYHQVMAQAELGDDEIRMILRENAAALLDLP